MKDFDTHGGTFVPQGFMQIEAGGTHEENPNGGVQVGLDPNGIPNMVEEDENIYQDFVYSNQITADASILKEFNLPEKYAGKSYSDIVNEYVDERRPEDPIANKTMNAMLMRLANAQEEQKKRQEMKEIEEELEKMTPEERVELEAMLAQQEGDNQFDDGGPKDSVNYDSIFSKVLNVGDVQTDQFGNIIIKGVPPMLSMPGASTVSTGAKLSARGKQALEGVKNRAKFTSWLKSLPGLTSKEEAARLAASDFKTAGTAAEVAKAVEATPEAVAAAEQLAQTGSAAPQVSRHIGRKIGLGLGIPAALTIGGRAISPLLQERQQLKNNSFTPTDSVYTDEPVIDWLNVEKCGGKINRYDDGGLPTWPRYAGAVTSGLFGLYNAFQRPDTYKVPRVSPTIMRTKLSTLNPAYRPQDANLAINDVLASGAGTARGLRNSGLGPSAGSALVALDKNIGKNIGTARTQVAGYNDNLLNSIIGQINSNLQAEAKIGLNRDRMNTSLLYDAALRNAQNSLTEQQMNYGAEGQHYGAIGSQMDQVAQALSDIGRENFAMNQIKSNPSLSYWIDSNGNIHYENKSKCGGLMKKYKK